MRKWAKILEWVGATILVSGAAFFSFVYFRKIGMSVFYRAVLLWIIGAGLLCYAPIGFFRYSESRAKADETHDAEDIKIAKSRKRSLSLKIICGIVLIGNGFLILWKASQLN